MAKCRKCKQLKGNELYVHRFSTHGLSFAVQQIEETPKLLELYKKHKETGKKSKERFAIK